jgi:hypothetical protein
MLVSKIAINFRNIFEGTCQGTETERLKREYFMNLSFACIEQREQNHVRSNQCQADNLCLTEHGFFKRKRELRSAVPSSKVLSINGNLINVNASTVEIKFASASLLSGDSEFPSPEEYFPISFAGIRNEDNILF